MTFYTFANATTAIALTELDANFATPITLGNTAVTINGTFSSIGNLTLNNATIASGNSTVTKETVTTITSPAATNLTIQSAGTTAMTIDTSQNVGIGTSSPAQKFHVYNAGSVYTQVQSVNAGTGAGAIYKNAAANWLIGAGPASGGSEFEFVDQTNGSGNPGERMRIDSSGNLLVGKTTPTYTVSGVSLSGGTNQFAWSANSGGTVISVATPVSQALIAFYRTDTGAFMGSIANGASNTVSYNTSSDHRLKENVTPITNGLSTIAALNPVNYDWINDKSAGEGFIAHELQAVIPHAVTGEKDAVDADGKPQYQGVDYSKIVVHLVAAIKELKAEFDAYKASHP